MDTETKLKKYEQWLLTLKILTALCLIITAILGYFSYQGKVDFLPLIIAALATVMFFMAYREKSNAPRPGSPEYEAIERAHSAKIEAQRDRIYRKQHPFDVARELVENNKPSGNKTSGSVDRTVSQTETVQPAAKDTDTEN